MDHVSDSLWMWGAHSDGSSPLCMILVHVQILKDVYSNLCHTPRAGRWQGSIPHRETQGLSLSLDLGPQQRCLK